MSDLLVEERPRCKTCDNLAEKYVYVGKVNYRSECTTCRRLRNGKPPWYGIPCGKRKRIALKLGFDCYHCSQCGWSGYCETHHKDCNPQNNNRENIEILCPNCHMDAHHSKPLFTPT